MSRDDLPAPTTPPAQPLADAWHSEGATYTAAVARFVETGAREGWDAAGDEPVDARASMFAEVWKHVLAQEALDTPAARAEHVAALRDALPPAHSALGPWISDHAVTVDHVVWLDDTRVLCRVRTATGLSVYMLDGTEVALLEGVRGVGQTGTALALAHDAGVQVVPALGEAPTADLDYPVLGTDLPAVEAPVQVGVCFEGAPPMHTLIPLSPESVLCAGALGVHVLLPGGALKLAPTDDALRRTLAAHAAEAGPDEPWVYDIPGAHAARQPGGAHLAFGTALDGHTVLRTGVDGESAEREDRADTVQLDPAFGAAMLAGFSADGRTLLLGGQHMSQGVTSALSMADIDTALVAPGHTPRAVPLEEGASVAAMCSHGDRLWLGDAFGYVSEYAPTEAESAEDATENTAQPQDTASHLVCVARHFVGGTIADMAVSPDGHTLAVGTQDGTLSLVVLNPADAQPGLTPAALTIGDTPHREARLWLFAHDESHGPLAW